MNNLKLTAVTSSIIILIVILITVIQLLLKKIKNKTDEEGELRTSYILFFSALFLSGSIVIKSAVSVVLEIIDAFIKIHPQNLVTEFSKSTSIVIGICFIWYLISFYIMKFIFKIICPKTNDELEMEKNSVGFFLAKGLVLISLLFCVSSILEIMLRTFIPAIEIPIYR